MKFKTNAKCGGCVSAIGAKLNEIIKAEEWSIDLTTKILEVKADVPSEKIVQAVSVAGFKAEQID
ncbi:heavy-metal-associated domain-containing protein [Massilibacteroides vaginae]|uniref:heavy-metal-associated domain-containing protein n=1 Tax=Massilibacteroides vaginae TaxID=1673718 RepID=UPI000A1C96AC|nr:cation transporter [Massilibacteroides vaginae]